MRVEVGGEIAAWQWRSDQGYAWDVCPGEHVVLEHRSGLEGIVGAHGGDQADVRIAVGRSHHLCDVLDLIEDVVMAATVVSLRSSPSGRQVSYGR